MGTTRSFRDSGGYGLKMHTGVPVTQFPQCVASGDMGSVVRWLRLSGGSSAEISSVSTLRNSSVPRCSVSVLRCLPSSQKAGKDVAMCPSALLRLSSPPLVHTTHCLLILCSCHRSPEWANDKQQRHVGSGVPKATGSRARAVFEKGFLLHHGWAEGITGGEQGSSWAASSPASL